MAYPECPTCGQEGTVTSVQSLDFAQKLSEVVKHQTWLPTQGCLTGMVITGIMVGGIVSCVLVPEIAWSTRNSDGEKMLLNLIMIFPPGIFAAIWFFFYIKVKSNNIAYVTSKIQSSTANTDALYCKICNGVFRSNETKVTPIKDAAHLFNLSSN